jgi:hypothetical protein
MAKRIYTVLAMTTLLASPAAIGNAQDAVRQGDQQPQVRSGEAAEESAEEGGMQQGDNQQILPQPGSDDEAAEEGGQEGLGNRGAAVGGDAEEGADEQGIAPPASGQPRR